MVPYRDYTLTHRLDLAQWLAVLELANEWGFDKIRGMAIDSLNKVPLDPVLKVEIGRKYGIDELLLSAYVAIALRETPLSEQEAGKLGYSFIMKNTEVRERILRAKLTSPETLRSQEALERCAVQNVVEVFGLGQVEGEALRGLDPQEGDIDSPSTENYVQGGPQVPYPTRPGGAVLGARSSTGEHAADGFPFP